MVGGIVRVTTPSGQYSQQVKQAIFLVLAGMQSVTSIMGRRTRHVPVLPASHGPGSLWDFLRANGERPIYFLPGRTPITVFSYTSLAALTFSFGRISLNSSL